MTPPWTHPTTALSQPQSPITSVPFGALEWTPPLPTTTVTTAANSRSLSPAQTDSRRPIPLLLLSALAGNHLSNAQAMDPMHMITPAHALATTSSLDPMTPPSALLILRLRIPWIRSLRSGLNGSNISPETTTHWSVTSSIVTCWRRMVILLAHTVPFSLRSMRLVRLTMLLDGREVVTGALRARGVTRYQSSMKGTPLPLGRKMWSRGRGMVWCISTTISTRVLADGWWRKVS